MSVPRTTVQELCSVPLLAYLNMLNFQLMKEITLWTWS